MNGLHEAHQRVGTATEEVLEFHRRVGGDRCTEAAGCHVHKVGVVAAAEIDGPGLTREGEHQRGIRLGRHTAGGGKVVGGAEREDAERWTGGSIHRHQSIGRLIDAAVAAASDHPRHALASRFGDEPHSVAPLPGDANLEIVPGGPHGLHGLTNVGPVSLLAVENQSCMHGGSLAPAHPVAQVSRSTGFQPVPENPAG